MKESETSEKAFYEKAMSALNSCVEYIQVELSRFGVIEHKIEDLPMNRRPAQVATNASRIKENEMHVAVLECAVNIFQKLKRFEEGYRK